MSETYDNKAVNGKELAEQTLVGVASEIKREGYVSAAAFNEIVARLTALEKAVAEKNLGERVADSLDAHELKVGGEDVTDASNHTVVFSQASSRGTVANDFPSGAKISSIFSKLKKWLSDLKTVAFTGSYNDLSNKPTIPAAVTVDQTYNASSTNPQSGTAVDGAVSGKQDNLPLTTDDLQDVVYNIRVAGARYANNAGRSVSAASADEAGTANLAGKALALQVNAAIGSGILPVYIGADGVPVACNVTSDDPQDVVANFRVVGARYANNAGTAVSATSAGQLSVSGGSVSQPVYFPAANDPHNPTLAGKPVPIPITNVTIGGVSTPFVTLQAYGAYSAKKLDANAGGIHQPVYFYNGVPVAIEIVQRDGVNYIDMAAASAYQATVALNAAAVNGKKIVIGGYGGAADTIYFG